MLLHCAQSHADRYFWVMLNLEAHMDNGITWRRSSRDQDACLKTQKSGIQEPSELIR